jgi:hypothetical protein
MLRCLRCCKVDIRETRGVSTGGNVVVGIGWVGLGNDVGRLSVDNRIWIVVDLFLVHAGVGVGVGGGDGRRSTGLGIGIRVTQDDERRMERTRRRRRRWQRR